MYETNRLAESEPLMRRAVGILLTSSRAAGHPLPLLETFLNNYIGVLEEMGRSEEQILTTLRETAPGLFEQ